MYNFKKKICTNHEKPKPLQNYTSPMGTSTWHCSECVNIIELGFVKVEDSKENSS